AYARLFPDRGDQAKHLPVMLDAFTHGMDIRIAGRHVVADQDAAVDVEPGTSGRIDVGADHDGEHAEIGNNPVAIGEQYRFRPLGAEDLFGLTAGEEIDPARFEIS